MALVPGPFPYPDSDAFRALPIEEQRWIQAVLPWFSRGRTAGSPTRVMAHPTMELFRADPRRHLPLLVKYYPAAPMLFEFALYTLTEHEVDASTPEQAQAAWQAYLKERFATAAAE